MASTRSGCGRPRASNRRRISLRPKPASIRRVVRSVSSNVALPVLPEARMDMRNEMRSVSGKDDGKVTPRRQRKKEASEPHRNEKQGAEGRAAQAKAPREP